MSNKHSLTIYTSFGKIHIKMEVKKVTVDKKTSKTNKVVITIKSSVLTYLLVGKEKARKAKKRIKNNYIHNTVLLLSTVSIIKKDFYETKQKKLKI